MYSNKYKNNYYIALIFNLHYIKGGVMTKYILPLFLFLSAAASSQIRIAILPFSNLDGNADYNRYCYDIQDSLTKAFEEVDAEKKFIEIISFDEVDNAMSDMNLDANTPNFDGEKWKVLEILECDRVISGTFRFVGGRFVINAYIYYPETRISDQDYQAKDIFKREEKIMEAVPVIVRRLSKAFIKD